MEYFTGLLHVIQLPEMKAPAKQEKLIIKQPYVPGLPGRQQYHVHLKLPSIPNYTAAGKHSEYDNIF